MDNKDLQIQELLKILEEYTRRDILDRRTRDENYITVLRWILLILISIFITLVLLFMIGV